MWWFAIVLVLLLPAPAAAQVPGAAPITQTNPPGVPASGGTFTGAISAPAISQSPNITLGASGIQTQNQFTSTVNVPNANMQGIYIAQDWQCIAQGVGSISGAGHLPCIQAESYSALSAMPLVIGFESVTGTLAGAGTLSNDESFLAKINNVSGATISDWFGLTNLGSNSGTIGFGALVYCQAWVGTPPGQSYCLFNSDPTQSISSAGPIVTPMGNMLTGTNGAVVGQYYYGISPGDPSGTVAINSATTIWWSPIQVDDFEAFRFIGVHISTLGTGTCQINVYSMYAGQPGTFSVINPVTISATATGDITGAVTYSGGGGTSTTQLGPGTYMAGVWCTSTSVVLSAYPEQAAGHIYGAAAASLLGTSHALTTNGGGSWPSNALTLTPTLVAGRSTPIIAFQR